MKDNRFREKIIDKISKKALIFRSRDNKLWRFFHDPFGVSIYLLLKIVSMIHPLWVTKTMPWGERMSFYLPEGNQIYYYGFCESNLTILITRFLKRGATFIDIGANIGFYSMLASFLVGDTGNVLSIEATPRTFFTLKHNSLQKNNITPINMALSNTKEEVTLVDYGPKFSGSNSINPITPAEIVNYMKIKGSPIKVCTTTLDDLLDKLKYNLTTPFFIKMDVEGHESKILQGMTKTIDIYRPIISAEMCKHPEWQNNVREAFNIFQIKNYDSFEISDEGYLVPCSISNYTDFNIIFIPNEKLQENAWIMKASS